MHEMQSTATAVTRSVVYVSVCSLCWADVSCAKTNEAIETRCTRWSHDDRILFYVGVAMLTAEV